MPRLSCATRCHCPADRILGLTPNLRGAERGLALGVHEMNFVLSVSEGHNRANVRRTTAELIQDFRRVPERQQPAGRAPGPVTQRLIDAYREMVDCDFVAQYLALLDG